MSCVRKTYATWNWNWTCHKLWTIRLLQKDFAQECCKSKSFDIIMCHELLTSQFTNIKRASGSILRADLELSLTTESFPWDLGAEAFRNLEEQWRLKIGNIRIIWLDIHWLFEAFIQPTSTSRNSIISSYTTFRFSIICFSVLPIC